MVSILCVGDDLRLLQTRAALLSQTDAEVEWCTGEDAAAAIEQKGYDLVVVCHSLTGDTAQQLSEFAHAHTPTTQVLRLKPLWSLDETPFQKGADAVAGAEPNQLIRVASNLLRSPARSTMPR